MPVKNPNTGRNTGVLNKDGTYTEFIADADLVFGLTMEELVLKLKDMIIDIIPLGYDIDTGKLEAIVNRLDVLEGNHVESDIGLYSNKITEDISA